MVPYEFYQVVYTLPDVFIDLKHEICFIYCDELWIYVTFLLRFVDS